MRVGVYIVWLHQTNTGFVRCRTDLCAKSYKIKKIGLKPLGKKIRSSCRRRLRIFFLSGIRAIAAARCDCRPTMSTDHGPTELEFRTAVLLTYTGSGMLARGDTI